MTCVILGVSFSFHFVCCFNKIIRSEIFIERESLHIASHSLNYSFVTPWFLPTFLFKNLFAFHSEFGLDFILNGSMDLKLGNIFFTFLSQVTQVSKNFSQVMSSPFLPNLNFIPIRIFLLH